MSKWIIEPLSQICITTSGGTPSRKKAEFFINGTIPWVKSGELENNIIMDAEEYITEGALQNSSAKILPSGTLLIALYGATIGKLAFLGIDAATNQAVCGIFKNDKVDLKYLYYYLLFSRPNLVKQGQGGAQPNISQTILKKLMVPYPVDLGEQQRIVARIEELFSQLDDAEATLQKTKAQLALYRQAVLKEAFDGRLTGSAPEASARLGDYIETPRYGTSKKCNYECESDRSAVYRIPNINYTTGRISHNDIKYAQFSTNELNGILLQQGDILIIRSNGSVSLVGRAAMVCNTDTAGTFAGYLMRLRIMDTGKLLPKYLLLYLGSHQARIYIENKAKSTSGVHNINSTEISDLRFPLYDKVTQYEIIEAVESRLSVCDNIEQTVDLAFQRAEAMRQSILKNVFEG